MQVSDLVITGNIIPLDVADKLVSFHLIPVLEMQKELGVPIWASLKSGYRPIEWEWSHGRSGNSQHTFKGNGAVDWTCENFKENKDRFLELLMTTYTRIAEYDTFFHCDYKGEEKLYFTSDSRSNWTYIRHF